MIKVVCGIISKSDNYFIAKRKAGKSLPGKWEFPGGKIHDNEDEQEALKRELLEELGMMVKIEEQLGEHIHKYPNFRIKLIAYRCTFITATFILTDHDEYKWVSKEELYNYDLAEADKPFIDLI